MFNKFQQALEEVYENLNSAGPGGSFGPENVYADPEKFNQVDTKAAMSMAGTRISKKKKLKSKKSSIIRRSMPEKIWN